MGIPKEGASTVEEESDRHVNTNSQKSIIGCVTRFNTPLIAGFSSLLKVSCCACHSLLCPFFCARLSLSVRLQGSFLGVSKEDLLQDSTALLKQGRQSSLFFVVFKGEETAYCLKSEAGDNTCV